MKLAIDMLFCCHSSLLNGQVKFCQGKHVTWHTCLADNLRKKTIFYQQVNITINLKSMLLQNVTRAYNDHHKYN